MSDMFHQFNTFEPRESSDNISTVFDDYVSRDLKLSENIFNDIFTDVDFDTNDIPNLDSSTNKLNSSHSFENRLTSSNAVVIPRSSAVSNSVQTEFQDFSFPNLFEPLTEENKQSQLTAHESTYSSAHQYPSSSSNDIFKYQTDQVTVATNCSQSSLPAVVQSLEHNQPITFTLEQFQALISSIPNASPASAHIISTLLQNSTILANNIPLTIVHESNPSTHESTCTDNISHQTSVTKNADDDLLIENSNGKRGRRKSLHNVIEKRYRSSINEKIQELKEIVVLGNGKIQKSAVLRQTIEYIRQLQSTNQRLEEENRTLKDILKQLNLTKADFGSNNDVQSSSQTCLVESSVSESTSKSTDEPANSVEKRKKSTKSKRGMVDGARLVLCCFMLCVLIINPFNYLLDRIHSPNNVGTTEIYSILNSRTLQTMKDNERSNSLLFSSVSWKKLVSWMLNVAICLVCLVKIFVHGEPIVYESDMDEYYGYKNKADALMSKNRFHEASIYYQKACEKLYTSFANTHASRCLSVTWQLIRLFLNFIFVGRWLTYWSGWTQSTDTRNYNRELNHCYVQLWKIEYYSPKSLVHLLNLFLLTINTSINSGKKQTIIKRNEIYLLSALTFKKFDGIFLLFIPYLLKYLVPIDRNDLWLLDINHLIAFIYDKKEIDIFKHNLVIDSVRNQFFEFILYYDIQNQLVYQDEYQPFTIKHVNELDTFVWWQHSLGVLRCISDDKQNINDITSTGFIRQVSTSKKTIYDMSRSLNLIDERYIAIIETIHTILYILTNNDNDVNSTATVLLEHLGQSSQPLSSTIDTCCMTHNENNLDMAIKTLLLDGILSLRLRLLTNLIINGNCTIPFLDDFKRELDTYKRLSQLMKLPKQKLYLFESIFRTSTGLNPLQTEKLFEYAMKRLASTNQIKLESAPDLDIVAALLLFCHFLPTTVHRYRNILQHAAAISSKPNKNNDLDRLQQKCLTLIRQSCSTFSSLPTDGSVVASTVGIVSADKRRLVFYICEPIVIGIFVLPLLIIFWQSGWNLLTEWINTPFGQQRVVLPMVYVVSQFLLFMIYINQNDVYEYFIEENVKIYVIVFLQLYSFLTGLSYIIQWTSMWTLWDYYTSDNWLIMFLISIASISITIALTGRAFDLVCAPFIMSYDSIEYNIRIGTPFAIEKMNPFLPNVLSYIFYEFIISLLSILAWRGLYTFLDTFLCPDDEDMSAILSLLIGYVLFFVLMYTQSVRHFACRATTFINVNFPLMMQNLRHLCAFLSCIFLWRGYWILFDAHFATIWFIEESPYISYFIVMVISFAILAIMKTSSSINGPMSPIGDDYKLFPIYDNCLLAKWFGRTNKTVDSWSNLNQIVRTVPYTITSF